MSVSTGRAEPPRKTRFVGALLASLGLLTMPAGVEAQFRRSSAVQPVADMIAGQSWVGIGAAHEANRSFALSGLSGDLTSIAVIHLAYALGPKAVLQLEGAAWQTLVVDASGASAVPLAPGVDDGRTEDAGDFELSLSLLPIGSVRGFSAGGHIGVKLPNTDEMKGIGPNTTDVTIAALFSWGATRWRATGWAGVGILEAPTRSFVQNDVFAYAFEWLWGANERFRFGVSAEGRASTRGNVPLGTEDLGAVVLTGEWRLGRATLDFGLGHGHTELSGDWRLHAGIAWALASRERPRHRGPES